MSKQLTRPRPTRTTDQDRTRVVFVRQPVKQVTQQAEPDDLLRSILITSAVAIAATFLLAAMGAIGSSLGFEATMGLPHRTTTITGSFVEGIMIVTAAPGIMLAAGESVILLPLLGSLWIGVPAALLTLARPRVPGAPLPDIGSRALAMTGAVAAILVAVASVVWCMVGPSAFTGPFPDEVGGYLRWRGALETVGAIDVFLFLGLVLWCVLGFRLGIARWAHALTCVAMVLATVIMFISMSTSIGLITELEQPRPVSGESQRLLVGNVGDAALLLDIDAEGVSGGLETGSILFRGTGSVSEMLERREAVQTDDPLFP